MLFVAKREIRLGFRNSWTYSFLILFTIFTIAILQLQSGVAHSEGYTDMTGTMMNMTLYVLPLTTLLLGGFSTTTEKENGQWELLSTYPITSYTFLWGKWIGIVVILATVIFFSFGLAGLLILLFGNGIALSVFLFFLLFSTALAMVYVSIAFLIGAIAKNRWQALIGGITIWFVTIVIWPLLIISLLSHLPSYTMVQPTLQIATLLNPAESIRVFSIMRLGSGSVFGADYYEWISWATSKAGLLLFILLFISWIVCLVTLSGFLWKRGGVGGAN